MYTDTARGEERTKLKKLKNFPSDCGLIFGVVELAGQKKSVLVRILYVKMSNWKLVERSIGVVVIVALSQEESL